MSAIILSVRHPANHPNRTKVVCSQHLGRLAWLEADVLVIPARAITNPAITPEPDWRAVRGHTFSVPLADLPETVVLWCRGSKDMGDAHRIRIPAEEIEHLARLR